MLEPLLDWVSALRAIPTSIMLAILAKLLIASRRAGGENAADQPAKRIILTIYGNHPANLPRG
jgi:hypothetical protein